MKNLDFRRFRRLRSSSKLRDLVRETELSPDDFIYPMFVVPGTKVRREVKSMPGVFQLSIDEIVRECDDVKTLGIPAVILFGIPELKDEKGSEAYKMRIGQPQRRSRESTRPPEAESSAPQKQKSHLE